VVSEALRVQKQKGNRRERYWKDIGKILERYWKDIGKILERYTCGLEIRLQTIIILHLELFCQEIFSKERS